MGVRMMMTVRMQLKWGGGDKKRDEKKLSSFPRTSYIFVIDAFHEHQLPVCPLGVGLVLEGSAQLLDGHISVQDSIVARTAGETHTHHPEWLAQPTPEVTASK